MTLWKYADAIYKTIQAQIFGNGKKPPQKQDIISSVISSTGEAIIKTLSHYLNVDLTKVKQKLDYKPSYTPTKNSYLKDLKAKEDTSLAVTEAKESPGLYIQYIEPIFSFFTRASQEDTKPAIAQQNLPLLGSPPSHESALAKHEGLQPSFYNSFIHPVISTIAAPLQSYSKASTSTALSEVKGNKPTSPAMTQATNIASSTEVKTSSFYLTLMSAMLITSGIYLAKQYLTKSHEKDDLKTEKPQPLQLPNIYEKDTVDIILFEENVKSLSKMIQSSKEQINTVYPKYIQLFENNSEKKQKLLLQQHQSEKDLISLEKAYKAIHTDKELNRLLYIEFIGQSKSDLLEKLKSIQALNKAACQEIDEGFYEPSDQSIF